MSEFNEIPEDVILAAMAVVQQRRADKNVKVDKIELKRDPEKLQIVLPESMSTKTAIEVLQKKMQDEERIITPFHDVQDAYPLDALNAFHMALSKTFGWVDAIAIKSFFGDVPPAMIQIATGVGEVKQLTWGRLQIPNWEGGYLQVQINPGPPPRLIIGGQCKQKFSRTFKKITDLTSELLKTDSIYKGKAIRTSWEWEREGEGFDPQEHCPKFLDIMKVDPSQLAFPEGTRKAIEIGLFAPILRSEELRQHNVSLKRGCLLEGKYGTGKTQTAMVVARLATLNNWTFIYLENVHDLASGLHLAAQYAPCVVFVEDIDKALPRERTEEVNEILNLMDGMSTKGHEIITVFTTNHPENLNRAFLRPGRLDTVIHVDLPDEETAIRLVKQYGGSLLDDAHIDWDKVGKALYEKTPAAIAEIVKRSKITAIYRSAPSGDIPVEKLVTTQDLLDTNAMVEPQLAMVEEEATRENRDLVFRLTADQIKEENK